MLSRYGNLPTKDIGIFERERLASMIKTFNGSSWDATLNSDVCDPYNNADLVITLKVHLRQVNPAGGAAEGTYHDYGKATKPTRKITAWTRASWAGWINAFAQTAQRYWNGKFWLLNDSDPAMDYVVKGVTFRPNLYCKFNLKIVNSNAHHTIDVVRLEQSESWFGSHSKLYDNLDTKPVKKGNDSTGKPIMQRAHVHEVGHLLGLGHVDEGKAHCPANNTNAKRCYGISDIDKLSVMGSGMQLRKKFASPWQQAYHSTRIGNFVERGHHTNIEMKRHYPRTLAEVKARKKIIRRPIR